MTQVPSETATGGTSSGEAVDDAPHEGTGDPHDPAYWSSLSPEEISEVVSRLTDGIVILGPDWRYRYLNQPAATMLGDRKVKDLLGKNIWSEFPDDVALTFRLAYERAAREGTPGRLVEYFEPYDRWFENRIFPQEDNLVIVFRDITEQQRAVDELREYAERMEEAERIVRFGVWKWEIATGRVLWSEQLHRIYGLEPGEFGGTVQDFLAQLHPEDRERVWQQIDRSMNTREPFIFEERIRRADGEERVLLSQGHPVMGPDDEIAALVGVCHDITDRTEIERALGTSERRMRAIVDNTPSVITVKDLDGRYVMTNLESGRMFGVPSEELIGKLCTDVFPPEVSDSQRGNEVLAAAEGEPVYDETVLIRDGEPRTFITVTFALPDEEGRPAETCTIATDVTEGREREEERLERLSWVERIDGALADDRIRAYAQPIIDLRSGEHVSDELLARMVTAGDRADVLAPAAFLPAAERYGLIPRIDCRMVERALSLPGDGTIQVNLSAVTLCNPAARDEIVGLLAGCPESAERIVFEITETAVAEHLDAALDFADDVVRLGSRLALDDFGTGFGSFTYLRTLPLSFLKIDLSFVRALAEDPSDRRIVNGIIDIAASFGLETIAEGIEEESTLELLRELGADYGQGFLLGRPAPLEPVEIMSRRSRLR